MVTSIRELAQADVIVMVGCDMTEEYPIIWLRMKQAVDRGARIIALHPKALEIDRFIAHHLIHRYGQGTDVLRALADGGEPGERSPHLVGGVPAAAIQAAAATLAQAVRPVVMIGRSALEAPDGDALLQRVHDLARRLGVPVNVMRGKGNAFGAALAGLQPDVGPGGRPLNEVKHELESVWAGKVSDFSGLNAPAMIGAASIGGLDVLYVIGADPATDVPDRSFWMVARERLPFLVVQDAFLTETAQMADVVLPALVSPEKDGTVTNIEGRVQRLHAAVLGPGEARSDWAILSVLAARLGKTIAYGGWEEIFDEMRSLIPGLDIDARVPLPPMRARSRIQDPGSWTHEVDPDHPLILVTGDVLFDRGSMTSRSPAVADLAGEPWVMVHPDDAARVGAADAEAVKLASCRGALAVRVKISAAVPAGQVYLPRGYDGAPANALVDLTAETTGVRIEVLVSFDPSTGLGAGSAQGRPVAGGSGREADQ
jgi:predicted molibdopterin-dependent oxidoreductase YjgC